MGIDYFMGRGDEEQVIIGYLMEQKDELGLIFVTGVSGLGKTTLARKIYVNEGIAHEFPIRIWIYVSKFNLEDVLRNIMRVFTSQDIHSLSVKELAVNVQSCLERKKFLLVLDNMQSPDALKAIQDVLPKSNGMGKVLITGHVNSIAEHANLNIEMRILNTDESWKLLQLKVFGNLEDCPPVLEEIGRNIADTCGGLPLQIMIAGGILAGQDLIRDEWRMVYADRKLIGVYELAYGKLTDDVRACFLYMGVFPRDYEISAWTVTRLWIAEGFVRPNSNQSLEETATRILSDLISMNLVMSVQLNPIGEVKTCRLHDLIRDFCVRTAMEHNLFKVIKRSEDIFKGRHELRRLSVHSDVKFLYGVPSNLPVRSFLYFDEWPIDLDRSTVIDAFKFLKVLYSKSIKFQKIPRQITKLFHLRYVTLSIDDLNILPESFSKLWNLQTLVVHTKSRVIKMKANIWRLIWLRHLKTNAAIVLSSHKEGTAGEILQTLNRLSTESCTADVFERACNLKTLGIQGNLTENMFLEKLEHLEKLKLINDPSENPECHLPQPNCFPPNLKWLTLTKTNLVWDHHMTILTKINSLKVLKLKEDAFTGVIWRAAGDCFPHLEFLLIESVDLVIWEASADTFPKLRSLVLKNCENLREIPEAVAENCLEKLEIEHLGKSAVDSARIIAQLKQQVQKQEKGELVFPFKLSIGSGCYQWQIRNKMFDKARDSAAPTPSRFKPPQHCPADEDIVEVVFEEDETSDEDSTR